MKLDPDLREKVIRLILRGRKVQAVKEVQQATKAGLKNSKDAVDRIAEELKGE